MQAAPSQTTEAAFIMARKREWGGWDENHTYLDIGCPWRPSCAAWLIDPSAPEPDHVCYDIARATVEKFAGDHLIIAATSFLGGWFSATAYPLPVGPQAIMRWLEETIGRQGVSIEASDYFKITPLPEFGDTSDAKIGLAIRREAWDGVVWLLGTVEILPPTGETIAWCIENIKGRPPDEGIAFIRREIFDGPYRFADPVLVFEKEAMMANLLRVCPDRIRAWWLEAHPNDGETAQEKGERLRRWYRANILGKSVGRPKGSGTFRDQKDFESTMRMVIASLRASGRDPTQESVAEYLSNHDRLPGVDRESPNCDARQIRRWCERWGVVWENLVGE